MGKRYLMKGNEALAETAIRCGCKFYFGYPITPQTEIAAYMAKRMPKIGGTFLQAESEISAINMTLGASAAGVRAMTSSSSPGISLKSEGVSYIAGSDLPCVIVNVQRAGPGLGGIQPAQSDYFQATRALGHGDYHLLVLAPNSVQETSDLTKLAFEKADEYRMPVMILSDGMLGQMMEPVELPEEDDAVLPQKEYAACGHNSAREHNVINSLYLQPSELEKSNLKRYERYRKVEELEVRYEEYKTQDADIVMVAFGACARICRSAVDQAREQGIKVGMFRPITLWPYPYDALRKIAAKAFLSVEMNMGQMVQDVRLAVGSARPVEFYGRVGGVVPEPQEIVEKLKEMARGL